MPARFLLHQRTTHKQVREGTVPMAKALAGLQLSVLFIGSVTGGDVNWLEDGSIDDGGPGMPL